jgi:RNA polymerase sigma-70 factor (ECF subfamily)
MGDPTFNSASEELRTDSLVPWDWGQARVCCLRETRRVLGATPAAEDAVQEALLRGWLKQERCRDRRNPLPWLAQIARNEALRVRAREMRHRQEPLEAGLIGVPAETETASQVDTRVDAHRMMATLPSVDRELIRLHYLEDLTQAETASRLGIACVTAKVRLHRLRARLRRQLAEAGHES